MNENFWKLDDFSIFTVTYAYVDHYSYLADNLFEQSKIKVKFKEELAKNDSPYRIQIGAELLTSLLVEDEANDFNTSQERQLLRVSARDLDSPPKVGNGIRRLLRRGDIWLVLYFAKC